jgi:PBP1b-binding outer membrane lipoprotein LpoB
MLAKDMFVGKSLITLMKIVVLPLATAALAAIFLAGCERQSENDTTASTNSAGEQPMPRTSASNNVPTPPAVPDNNTNNPAVTNWSNTNNTSGTNQ